MTCPRCNQDTATRRLGEVVVDVCARCGGMFLDRGELNKVAEPTEGDLEYSTLHEDDHRHADAFEAIACPRCGRDAMAKVEFNIHTGIILDHCDGCGGFWLDGRELERINAEVRELNDASSDVPGPRMLWFAHFIWGLPR